MVESPCVACCRLNGDKFCVGCYRHITEIVGWSRRPDDENLLILEKIVERKQDPVLQNIADAETSPITQAEWQAAKRQINALKG